MPTSPIVQAFMLLALLTCALAIWKGGPPERVGGMAVAAASILGVVAQLLAPKDLIPVVYLAGDGVIALVLLLATLRYASPWLGGVMLLYAAQFALHGYYFVLNRPPDLFHAVFNNLNAITVVALLLVGTLLAWRRRTRATRKAAL